MASRIGLRDGAERGAFLGVILGLAFVFAFGVWFGLERTDREVGSNAVGVGAVIAAPDAGDRFCVRAFHLPVNAERVEFWMGAPAGPTGFDLIAVSKDGKEAVRSILAVGPAGLQKFELPKTEWPNSDTSELCIVPDAAKVDIAGAAVGRLPGDLPATYNGEPNLVNEPVVHFYTGADDRPFKLQQLYSVFANSRSFHGPLFPWVMLLTLVAALAASAWALRLLVTAERHSIKRLAVGFMLVSFLWCAAWSVMSPPYQGNDESEHFANLEYVAMTGKAQSNSARNPNRPYSTHQLRTMEAYHHSSVVVDGTARPFWTPGRVDRLDAALEGASRADGGGYTVSASGHSGLYYSLFAPVYRLTTWMQPANQLVVLRIFNSAAASLVALLAVLCAALLLGGARRYAAATAGALIAFQPMYAYVSGAINNDTFVNVAGALTLYLLLWLARRGWDTRREIALGVAAVLGPVGKLTGATSALFAAVFVLALIARERTTRSLRGGLTVLAAVVATAVAYLGFAKLAGWPAVLANHHRDAAPGPSEWIASVPQRIDYALQTAIPWIELTGPMTQVSYPLGRIYIVGGFADLFWHRVAYPIPVYKMIAALLAVVVICGLVALWRHRGWVRRNFLPLAMVLAHPVAVYFMVEWAYATPGGRPVLAEQGRYIFPALVAFAVAAAGAGFGLPEKLRTFAWGGLVGLFCAFGIVTYVFGAYGVYG